MIRILSIEDHWIVVDGLRARFRGDRDEITITCSAGTMDEALAADPSLFDVILLDLLIPGTDPAENVRRITSAFPGKPVIILTSEERTVWELQMCRAGARAYLTKNDPRRKLKEVIRRVAAGEDLCRQRLAEELMHNSPDTTGKEERKLKPTEKAILDLFIREKNMKEIGAELHMTESAVAKTMARLRNAYQVKSNQGLVLLLREASILTLKYAGDG
jgi:DNA-binding NarL/FixJ family response regulator